MKHLREVPKETNINADFIDLKWLIHLTKFLVLKGCVVVSEFSYKI